MTTTPETATQTQAGADTRTEELGSPLDVHVEVFVSTLTHEEIRLRCWCEIGRTHTYEEAVA